MSAPAKPMLDVLRDLLSYDAETGVLRWRTSSANGARTAGAIAGTVTPRGYRSVQFHHEGKFRAALAHRIAWFLHYGEQPPEQIDHINRNRDDNRIANLRAATAADNARHRGPIRGAEYKGVTYDASSRTKKPWRAYIHVQKRRIEIGRFRTQAEALAAYQVKAKELHGEFASWN